MTTGLAPVSYIRQSAILNPQRAEEEHITVLGCGTVGSNAAVQLARAGFKRFHLVDMDVVEEHNIPSQAFRTEYLGHTKTASVGEEIIGVSHEPLITYGGELYGGEQFKPGVLIAAVDSMEMRKKIFDHSLAGITLFMDFRMSGNTLQAWCFDPRDEVRREQYSKTLYSSADTVPAVCGTKTFAPVGALSGAIATQFVTKHLRDGDHPPFYLLVDFDRFNMTPIGLPPEEEDE